MKKQSSFKIWEGNSPYNNEPISAIVTGADGSSHNPKTGAMMQLWILPSNINPKDAIKTGEDTCVCGDCVLKPSTYKQTQCKNKTICYVAKRAFQAPRSVWQHNIHRPVELDTVTNIISSNHLPIRYGAYGDPAMIPEWEFKSIHVAACKNNKRKAHTAYTHQHNRKFAQWIKRYAMASVEHEIDGMIMRSLGWRTFRVTDGPEAGKDEIICPNFTHGIQCINCGLCNGRVSESDNRKSITIPRH